ncbi:beta-ketoacyl synthase-like protein [Micromonospora endolithica]|nr:beta-ketoacyl synthase-like protein [Micromonospora endolithica]
MPPERRAAEPAAASAGPEGERMTEDKLREYLKRATAELLQTKQHLRDLTERDHDPIVITAVACRFPGGVATPEQLWQLLAGGPGRDPRVPDDRGWDLGRSTTPTRMRPAARTPGTAVSSMTCPASTRSSSGSARARPSRWTRSSGCCSSCPGRRWSGRSSIRVRCAAVAPASSSAPTARTISYVAERRRKASRGYLGTGVVGECADRPGGVHVRLRGPGDHGRHGLLVVAGGGAPGRAGDPQRRVRPGPGRRRNGHGHTRASSSSSPASAGSPRTGGSRRSPKPPTGPRWPRAPVCCCSNGSRWRRPPDTPSSP